MRALAGLLFLDPLRCRVGPEALKIAMPRPASHDDRQFSNFLSVHAQEWNTAKVRFEVKTGKAPLAFCCAVPRTAGRGGLGIVLATDTIWRVLTAPYALSSPR